MQRLLTFSQKCQRSSLSGFYITGRLSLLRHMTYQRLAPTVSIQLFVTWLVAMPTSRATAGRCF